MHHETSEFLSALDRGDRDAESRALSIHPSLVPEAWRSGSEAYVAGRYGAAATEYRRYLEAPSDTGDGHSTALLRYVALHRLAFSSLKLGRVRACEQALGASELVIAMARTLEPRRSDISAMRAHLRELKGDFESAAILFEDAHSHAREHGHWARAITTASDRGRIAEILGRPLEAVDWLTRAASLAAEHEHDASAHARRTVSLRLGIARGVVGDWGSALVAMNEVLGDGNDRLAADLRVDALVWRAKAQSALGDIKGAETDLRTAVGIAVADGLGRHEAYVLKDLARILRRSARGAEAVEVWKRALVKASAGDLESQPLVALQLTEDLLQDPRLANVEELPPGARRELLSAMETLRVALRPTAYQQHVADEALARAVRGAFRVLKDVAGATRLWRAPGVTIDLDVGDVTGGGPHRRLPGTLLDTLNVLIGAGTERRMADIAHELGEAPTTVHARIKRLRETLGPKAIQSRKVGREWWWRAVPRG